METIKLFMDEPGCIFVIGAAGEIIEKALKERYEEDAAKFMDKIVQVSFNLPLIPGEDFSPFLESISGEIKDYIAPFMNLILPSMENNPRRLKRFLNNLSLQRGLIKSRGISIKTEHILLWNIIDYIYPALKRDIADNPKNFYFLKDKIKQVESQIRDKERWEIPQDIFKDIPQSFHAYIRQKELVEIIKKFDCNPEQLNQLITMKAVVESRIEAEEKIEKEVLILEEKMTEVAAGEFLYGDDKRKEKIEQAYMIDIYPVTNAQFEKFMRAGGYENKKYWSERGWKWRTKNNIIEPGFWKDPKRSEPDHPVVCVSFYEAEAYAQWSGKRLPTEIEWERAARGTDGREYPWGNEFDKEKCNTEESGIGLTTRVTRYANGISPVGCYDMAGNVWELTDSFYDKSKKTRALRGGSWLFDRFFARCASRLWFGPDDRLGIVGFRCVRTKE